MKRGKAPRKISCAILGFVVAINGAAFADENSQTVEVRVQADKSARARGPFDISQIKAAQGRLVELGFEVARCGHNPAEGIFRLEIDSADDVRLLSDNGFDVAADPAGAASRGALVESSYFDPGEILTMLNQTAIAHPDITQVITIGTTIEGRPIRAIEISNNPGAPEDEPAIQFNAQHHAREVATSHIVIDLINQLTDQYGVDSEITDWVNNYKTVCVPMVNPDGVQYVFSTDDFWRKNRRTNSGCGSSGTGVDLNRNYPYLWGPGCGSSNSCTSSIFRGPSAASELETQTMMDLQDQYRFTIATSYHSYGRFIDYPYACSSGAPSGQMPEHGIIHEMMIAMAGAISAVDGVTYDPYTPVPFGGVNGDDTSWYYAHEGVYPFIVEVGEQFAPPFAEVANIINRNRAGWEYLYDRLGQARMDLRVADHLTGLPLEAQVEMLQQDATNILFDTGELDRFSEPTFGRSRWVTEANHTYTMRISKSGYQTRTIQVPVVNSPVDVPVLLLPNGVTLGDEMQDGDVDLADYAEFQKCFDVNPIQTTCRIFDMNADEAVNLSDLDEWTAALSGP
jgi:hypothetical protein